MQVIAISNLRAIKANKPLLWNTLLSSDQQKTCKDRAHCKLKLLFQLSRSKKCNYITYQKGADIKALLVPILGWLKLQMYSNEIYLRQESQAHL